ncbi:ATP12 family chaperone protein [Salipiger mucosus]|uniref:Chaperone n=1 Tax=Salipiger mucosus DSM 16094 TaxID=1123237 RepID=S9R4P9_9RHOB|nr:ATP12 family protein [Salipiger mucosus]EPX86907.1 Chaperone [Salipiger mucosus DSM 16094]
MSEWAPKRFYDHATVEPVGAGWTVHLDARPLRTPGKSPLVVPTPPLAQAIADEWQAQEGTIDPTAMPFTRTANSAIEKVAPQRAEVAQMLADYGDSDLLCYRADHPEGLVRRQAEGWDPMLDWAERTLGARLEPRTGVMHAAQSPAALEALSARVHALDSFELAAFHDLVSLTGSLVLGFAAAEGQDGDTLWALSRIDETWQEELWGVDDEAHATAERKRAAFHHARRFFALCKAA